MRTFIFILLSLSFGFFSCQQASDAANSVKKGAEQLGNAASDASTKKYTLTPFAKSKEFLGARINSMSYEGGNFTFDVSGGGYELGQQTSDADQKNCANSGKGQHIHLIVDDKPYAAKYSPKFEYDIPDGEHYLLAFLSRSYHESIKSGGASVVQRVLVQDKSIKKGEDVKSPMLFYSRPKGTYVGSKATKKVMLDFFLANTGLGNGIKVKASINGETHIIDTWQPYYIEGLPMGENTIELTLLGKQGNPMNIPLNPVSRTFTLKADELEAK